MGKASNKRNSGKRSKRQNHSRKLFYDVEKVLKGAANHRRLEILLLLSKRSDLSTAEIVEELGINYQTGSSHVRSLMSAGLVYGRRMDREVLHTLTPVGKDIITFLKMS